MPGTLLLASPCHPQPTSLTATRVSQERWGTGCCYAREKELQPRSHISSVPRPFHTAIRPRLLACTSQAGLSPLDGLGLSARPLQRRGHIRNAHRWADRGRPLTQESLPAEGVPRQVKGPVLMPQRSPASECAFLTLWAWGMEVAMLVGTAGSFLPEAAAVALRGWWWGQLSKS